ncbi:MAG: transposase [Deltaproteobacteria bacterium]|jgi:transposase|nr:transposase [Deltaproteobacteria bacterium]
MQKKTKKSFSMEERIIIDRQKLESIDILRVKYNRKEHVYELDGKVEAQSLVCPMCGSRQVMVKEYITRKFLGVPLRFEQTEIDCQIPIVECQSCNKISEVKIVFADKNKKYTNKFYSFFAEVINTSNIIMLNEVYGIPLGVCYSVFSEYLEKEYGNYEISNLKELAIDEIFIDNGHICLTVAMDLETKRVVWVNQGQSQEALDDFWARFGPTGAKNIKVVAVDPTSAYFSSITENLPTALMVFDQFHIEKFIDKQIGQLKQYVLSNSSVDKKFLIEGQEFVRIDKSLDLEPKELSDLALKINEPLTLAYYLKEDIGKILSRKNKDKAVKFLNNTIDLALAYHNPIIKQMADNLKKYSHEMINRFEYKIKYKTFKDFYNKVEIINPVIDEYRDITYYKLLFLGLHNPAIVKFLRSGLVFF